MDYELKYVIAICLIVKIAALSPEFSIGEETESPEQSPSRVEASLSTSPETQATSAGRPNQGRLFDWGPGEGKFNGVKATTEKDVGRPKKIKENQTFDTCEHMIELLESSLNWRDIRKTLHWLERFLSSNQTHTELCHRRKYSKRRPDIHAKIKNEDLRPEPKNKKSTEPGLNWATRNSKRTIHSRRNKKLRKERKRKHKSWKNRSREEWNEKEKLKNKLKESPFGKYFHKKFPSNNVLAFNDTILKPNSALFDEILFQRAKNKGESNLKSHQFRNSRMKNVKKCEGLKCGESTTGEPERESRNLTERWSEEMKLNEHGGGKEVPKQKPWPHFVYHRVSSNFLHSDSANQNHRQSAYIAISVVTSSKPDPTDNNVV